MQILHDEVTVSGGRGAEVINVDDVIVPDSVDHLRLVHETRDDLGTPGKLWVNCLEGDLAVDHRMLGQKDGTHSTNAKPGGDVVVTYGLTDVDHCPSSFLSKGRAKRSPQETVV